MSFLQLHRLNVFNDERNAARNFKKKYCARTIEEIRTKVSTENAKICGWQLTEYVLRNTSKKQSRIADRGQK